jgi:hypothetical protein
LPAAAVVAAKEETRLTMYPPLDILAVVVAVDALVLRQTLPAAHLEMGQEMANRALLALLALVVWGLSVPVARSAPDPVAVLVEIGVHLVLLARVAITRLVPLVALLGMPSPATVTSLG